LVFKITAAVVAQQILWEDNTARLPQVVRDKRGLMVRDAKMEDLLTLMQMGSADVIVILPLTEENIVRLFA